MDTPRSRVPSAEIHNEPSSYKQVAVRLFMAALVINPIVLDVASILIASILRILNPDNRFSLEVLDAQYGGLVWIITASLIVVGLFFLHKSRRTTPRP